MNGFLLDENIPNRFSFTSKFPILHAREIGVSLSDTVLWEYARDHEFVIVTKDADFSHRVMLSDPPPWIVHLRIGNMRRKDFHEFLARVWPKIEDLLPENKLINVYLDTIEAVA